MEDGSKEEERELADYVTVHLWREIFSTSFESSIETERYINFRRSISNVTGVAP